MANAVAEKTTAVAGDRERSEAAKYLTFDLAGEVYGLEILKVQEIIGIMRITQVPTVPDFVRGVINLRGRVIPVVDLRLKFEMSTQEDTERTCVIVVQIQRDNAAVTIGIVVDEVREVAAIDDDQIEPTPSFGTSVNTDFILGMGKTEDKVVILLDIERVLSTEDMTTLSNTIETQET